MSTSHTISFFKFRPGTLFTFLTVFPRDPGGVFSDFNKPLTLNCWHSKKKWKSQPEDKVKNDCTTFEDPLLPSG